jgi:hypothetical protein
VSQWWSFYIAWMITGSPVAAMLVMLAAYAIADWHTVGLLRRVAAAVADWRRGRRLRIVLLNNPHDRKARADLGDILVSQRRWAKVIEIVKPLADADPHDLRALFALGLACVHSGRVGQGELFLRSIHEAAPDYRGGAALLELGRARLDRRDAAAREPLLAFVAAHPHHVEARFLLSRAHLLAKEPAAAAAERDRCWKEYETSLPGHRRRERIWAWRARPSRPLAYALALCSAIALVGSAVQRNTPRAPHAAADVRSAP